MKNNRGFSFTFDATIAVILLALALVASSSITITQNDFSTQVFAQKVIADDLLGTGIQLNKFDAMNESEIEEFIEEVIPPNFDYWLEIKKYDYSGEFVLNSSEEFGTIADFNATEYVQAKRIFFNDGYSVAKIRIWAGVTE